MTDAAEPLDAEGGGLPDPNPAAAGGACWEHDWGGRSTQTRPSSAAVCCRFAQLSSAQLGHRSA